MNRKRRRNSLRHQGWHYGAAGYYFVTICTAGRDCLFDSAEFHAIASTTLQKIPSYKSATTVRLDAWVVMPNHIHLILVAVSYTCLLYTSPSPRDGLLSRMPSSA